MKQIIFTLFLTLSLTACKVSEKPEFLKVENIELLNATSNTITLGANVLFNNPNQVGGTLNSEGIKVFVNNTEVANVTSQDFKVPAKDKFSVPLQVNIPTKKVFNDKNLGGLLSSILSKEINVQYKGTITYKALGLSYNYDIDETKNIKIKL